MAADAVTIEATCGDGYSLETLAELVRRREQALRETTEEAVTATAINILKSIRARTRVANPNDPVGVLVARRGDLLVSWSVKGGKRHLCVRCNTPRGPHYTGTWYSTHKGNITTAACYFVRDAVSKDASGLDKKTYVLIANSEQEAREYALAKHRTRVARYAGLAKKMLGVLMHQVSEGAQGEASAASAAINAVIGKTAYVSKSVSGFASGSVTITVGDLLNYAIPAVEGGEQTVTLAIQKTANTTAAIINKCGNLPLEQQIETPFPEVKGKR